MSCCEWFKKWWRKYSLCRWTIIWIVVLLGVTFCVFKFSGAWIDKCSKESPQEELEAWFSFLKGVGAVIVIIIAYIQFTKILNKNTSEFLLHMDDALRDESILKAKRILRRYYLEYGGNLDKVADEILTLSREPDIVRGENNETKDEKQKEENEKNIEDFIHILAYFNFVDMVGFFYCRGEIQLSEIDDLMGESVIDLYAIAKKYIIFSGKQDYFVYFKKVSDELKQRRDDSVRCMGS